MTKVFVKDWEPIGEELADPVEVEIVLFLDACDMPIAPPLFGANEGEEINSEVMILADI